MAETLVTYLMATNFTVYGLRHKKARILGEKVRLARQLEPLEEKLRALQTQVDDLRNRCKELEEQAEVISKTLEIGLNACADVQAVKNCGKWAKGGRRGAFKDALLEALSASTEPQTTRAIAQRIANQLGIELDTPGAWERVRRQTKEYLRLLFIDGKVSKEAAPHMEGGSLWLKA